MTDILLSQHIQKYKQFIFSWYQAVASRFWTCLYRTLSRKKQKFVLLYQEGESRIDNALDVRQIIETHESVHLLKKLLLSQQSRTLFRLQRDKLLEFGGSESDLSSACSMDIDALRTQSDKREDFIESLSSWKVRTNFEKKLVLGIMHRKGHKNFEEQEENDKLLR